MQLTVCTIENLQHYSLPSVSSVLHSQVQPTSLCSTYCIAYLEKNPHVSGSVQFKLMLFRCQLYTPVIRSFWLLCSVPLYGYTAFFKIHLQVDGHLDCFYFLVTVNNAAMNICVTVFSCLLGRCLGMELLDHSKFVFIYLFLKRLTRLPYESFSFSKSSQHFSLSFWIITILLVDVK